MVDENEKIEVQDVGSAHQTFLDISKKFGSVIVGQHSLLESILVCLLTDSHLLIEGVPGLAKTTAVRTIASATGSSFVRIQCTPDMLPSDIIGTQIYNQNDHNFTTQLGPIAHQFVLVDEINRTTAKTQSALLEAMQERQVSIGGRTFDMPEPFTVMATQNPIEQEGTYVLPEAQLDRFLIKHIVTYPTFEEEMELMKHHDLGGRDLKVEAVTDPERIKQLQKQVKTIHADERVMKYIASVVQATRNPENFGLHDLKNLIQYGASPRASLALLACGRAAALMGQGGYVTPDHVKPYIARVLRHRIGLTYEAEAENITTDQVINRIADSVVVP